MVKPGAFGLDLRFVFGNVFGNEDGNVKLVSRLETQF